jgi:hypothetical protein
MPGRIAAILTSFSTTCKRLGVDPFKYLGDTSDCLSAYPQNNLDDPLPNKRKLTRATPTICLESREINLETSASGSGSLSILVPGKADTDSELHGLRRLIAIFMHHQARHKRHKGLIRELGFLITHVEPNGRACVHQAQTQIPTLLSNGQAF